MRMYDLIEKKREGGALTDEEIDFMITGYTKGDIPDYQMSAMMMAIYFQGMNDKETLKLTTAMRDSGDQLDLSAIEGRKVDKHSTGGVGDKTSIALTPLVASVGVKVAKMSGRGLGHTGGTIDKLESFDGFRVDISNEQFIKQVNTIGVSIMGQTKDLAPADKKLYALRDVTATVENISLIASSIMSKKLAAGADAIVLDVKTGSGAFMKNLDDARALAKAMVTIGKGAGRDMFAFITDMDEPLGHAVGNALEVKEAIDTLKGKGPADFTELVLNLACRMVMLSGIETDEDKAMALLKENIANGKALDKLAEFVSAQGGDSRAVYDTDLLPKANNVYELKADKDGYITHINCEEVGIASLVLGGGRETLDSVIDLSVGIVLNKKCGDKVSAGDVLAYVHYNDDKKKEDSVKRLKDAYQIGDSYNKTKKVIIDKIC